MLLRMTSADDEIRDQLLARGDDGRSPRHTIFYFFEGDIDLLEEVARASGFSVSRMTGSRGLILEKTLAVDGASFAPTATLMERWAEQFGSDYDGWECELVADR